MWKVIAGIVVLAVLVVLGIAATKRDTFSVARSIVIDAPPDRVYPLVADFHQWGRWSPWEQLDPAMKRSFAGPDAGIGASYAWDGNAKAGRGRMEIVEADAPNRLAIRLQFEKPMEATDRAVFAFVPEAAQTRVAWSMDGPMPFVSKLMSVFVSMDRLIGPDFERGLVALKAAAEQKP